ncbi:AAA family ATPase [Kineococcus sp. SYSU DK001]|uniref:AAA family ATPase n=1 Tax=Kineococcus sp. SYSU DK001 TaxID=3383122 RepID=UPI003D7CB192
MEQRTGLTRVIVTGLFGLRNYDIRLDESATTVLTGGNGTGKSTILRLINAVATGDVRTLVRAPVSELTLIFVDQSVFRLTPEAGRRAAVNWRGNEGYVEESLVDPDIPEWAHTAVLEGDEADEQMELLRSAALEAEVSTDEVIRVRRRLLARRDSLRVSSSKERRDFVEYSAPDWFSELSENFAVLFVSDQRLVTVPGDSGEYERVVRRVTRSAVEAASLDISEQMRRVDTRYAHISQMHDRRFPRDVIDAMSSSNSLSVERLETLISRVSSKREMLRGVGLLELEDGFEPEIAGESLERTEVRPVLATFLTATLRKLAVLEELAEQLQLFKQFLDDRFDPKVLVLTRRSGLKFRVASGALVRASQLSSGEQQMLILAYEVLFRSKPGTLVIIDEPELSLHVRWQHTLLQSLRQMGAPRGLHFLLATHSPVLLASTPEVERSLDEDLD